MKHIMLDLETMATSPDAAIVSIGAVTIDFKNNSIDEGFYRRISLQSSMHSGGAVDASTIEWWLKQDRLARREIYSATTGIEKACLDLKEYISDKDARIWGDGASFDNVILNQTYNRLGAEAPWKYWNDRCYRTVKNIYSDVDFETFGTAHNALDDAKSQALHLLKIAQYHPEVAA